ncbi:unnamed protein product (macronuclear) [Paramecium tetraurelia]|uniref:Transmembrane protein n=1 Tax=Paramecium tetraurelia TaxID=5888 RepID=A0BTQ1_PARTE|nr:uncharacterized protein GSPATT00032150001 [Paramecium tetraurelia]CAK61918.1 unnamed protein product [Paramecium tetraurelia]|eukprot:XP_001429316.1 hypothetical protein (macronuclear) [Paramecium tetraurelia strain d4-2]
MYQNSYSTYVLPYIFCQIYSLHKNQRQLREVYRERKQSSHHHIINITINYFLFEFIFNCTLITLILTPQFMQHFHQIPEIKYLIQKDNLFSSNSTSDYKNHSIFVSAQLKNKRIRTAIKSKFTPYVNQIYMGQFGGWLRKINLFRPTTFPSKQISPYSFLIPPHKS